MEKIYKYCQSCGMPMKRDPLRGGTNADGTKSTVYCSYCFQRGRFSMPNLTIDQMKERVKGKLNDFGFPRFMASMFTRKLHKLERWKTA
jgi:putative zinc ribbon protein